MDKKYVFSALFSVALMILISGCLGNLFQTQPANASDNIRCDPPYMRLGAGCCLDKDANQICDKDETSTTQEQTTVTVTETVTTSTVEPTATTVPQATETTLAAASIACAASSDCGSQINYTKCGGTGVIMYYETPMCTNPGRADAACIKKAKTQPYETCAEGESCIGARCVNSSMISCQDACYDKGYGSWYCGPDVSCTAEDIRASMGDISCSPGHTDGYCCCKKISELSTTSISETTTTTLLGATHSVCAGTSCVEALGPGPNMCATDADCGAATTTTIAGPTHRACVGTTCKTVSGAGIDTCINNVQCAAGPLSYHYACTAPSKCQKINSPGISTCTVNSDCMLYGVTTTTILSLSHMECTGPSKCQRVAGLGPNTCTTNINCMYFVLPTTTFKVMTTMPGISIPKTSFTVPTTLLVPPEYYL